MIKLFISKFDFKGQIITQTVKLFDDEKFYIDFELFAPLNSDIFSRFEIQENKQGWFYTFNSADLRRRDYIFEDKQTKGSNYYPINSGFMVETENEYLSFFPSFSTGAGMPDSNKFEIHLHRHPYKDDHLGLGSYVEDSFSVKHSWLITRGKLSLSSLWNSFLSHKASPSLYFVENSEYSLNQNYSNSKYFSDILQINSNDSMFYNDPCKYVSRVSLSNKNLFYRILNICENQNLDWLEEFTEVNFVGINSKERIELIEEGIIEDKARNNNGDNLIRYQQVDGSANFAFGDIKSFVSIKNRPLTIENAKNGFKGKENYFITYVIGGLTVFVLFVIIIGIMIFKNGKIGKNLRRRRSYEMRLIELNS